MASFSLFLAALIVITHAIYTLSSLVNNIRKAKAIGLPYTLTPIHELEHWAYITDPVLRRFSRAYLLRGEGWPRWARFMIKDWHYEDKGRAHREYGSLFVVVSPGGLICYVADSHAALQVNTKRRAFVKPPDKMKMLEPFGPNIGSTDGDMWKVHSRVASPSFDEYTQKLVWAETQRHTSMLVAIWSANNDFAFEKSVYSLTMDVMGTVSFGQQAAQNDNKEERLPKVHRLSLLGALRGVIMHLPHILLVPKAVLRFTWNKAYTAYSELDQYMDELLLQGSRDLSECSAGMRSKQNLLKAILRSSKENEKREPGTVGAKVSLTNQEIKGNLFIFLLAGYDTTANTIIYACVVLTLYPNIQSKILDEVKEFHEIGAIDAAEKSSSEHLVMFPYLLAFMHEILRVFPVIIPIARQTVSAQQVTNKSECIDHETVTLPGGMDVVINNTAIHFSESYWPSPDVIDPRRWLVRDSRSFDPLKPLTSEQELDLENPVFSTQGNAKGTFMTFGEGPRACLGRNFAKVEFVAFFSTLLQNHRLELQGTSNPTQVERDLRLLSGGSPVTLIPPHSVGVRLVPHEI
ncbi:cytochrome P450 [Xylaria bambusicola]|uniref:cytochrome P450 n=1 Tax=Xylaria bambusicola TaxID=326684 RepID=UPI0020084B9C|nr:cytochrome P450 [Xylaria bambusicola]KAI0506891.1 cytochrome P450 [Xylaria bambusicola]